MPVKKAMTHRRKKKVVRHLIRRRKAGALGSIPRTPRLQLFPERYRTQMKNTFFVQQPVATSAADAVFGILGNCLHLPLAAAVSNPSTINFNQATSLSGLNVLCGGTTGSAYQQYRIYASRIQVHILSTSGSSVSPLYITLLPNVNKPTETTINQPLENEIQYAKSKLIPGNQTSRQTLTNAMTTSRMFGLKSKLQIEGSEYAGSNGVNPVQQWAWFVYVSNPATSATTVPFICEVTVEYDVEFFDRNEMALGSL